MKKLKKGDLIGIIYNNRVHLGIFIKYGSRNNPNFWYLSEYSLTCLKIGKRLSTGYINRNDWASCVKLDELYLENDNYVLYNEMKNFLMNDN